MRLLLIHIGFSLPIVKWNVARVTFFYFAILTMQPLFFLDPLGG